MKIEMLKTSEIIPYEKNPRKNDAAVDKVAASIKEFGFLVPIVIDRNNVIAAGHTRLKAALQLGIDRVPCVRADDLTDEQIKAFRLADNKTAEFAEWDFTELDKQLEELMNTEIDMSLFGFEFAEDEPEITEDEPPEVDEKSEPTVKRGQVWKLGEHRLMCGDSTSPEDMNKLCGGGTADLLLTDPPYGINAVKGGKIEGDKHYGKVGGENIVESNEYAPIIGDDTTETAKQSYLIMKGKTNNQIIFGGNYFTDFLPPSRCWLVWDKENTGNFADVELAWTSFDRGAKLYRHLWNGLIRKGNRKEEGLKRIHPTQKPVGMIANIIRDFSSGGGIVIDAFGGSGTTMIACEQLGRKCLMMEIDPHYCDVIVKRWEDFTGKKAVLSDE